MRKKFLIGCFISLAMISYGSQLELKGGYEYWRESSNHTSSFDQGTSLGAEVLFNSLTKPLDYGLGIEWKSEFSGGGNDTSLGDSSSNAYPIYLTAKYDLYKDIYAVGRAGWVVFDSDDVNDGLYGAIGLGKRLGKWSIEALYESMDIGSGSDLYSGERAEVASIKFGYRFGENSRDKAQRELENSRRLEAAAKLRAEPIIERNKKETFTSVIVATDYSAYSNETSVLNEEVLNKITEDLEGKSGVLKVNGYTDNSGSEEQNLKLSQERAEKIANQINGQLENTVVVSSLEEDERVNNSGITIIPKGYGATSFITDNSTLENRRRNRRVEIEFIELKGEN